MSDDHRRPLQGNDGPVHLSANHLRQCYGDLAEAFGEGGSRALLPSFDLLLDLGWAGSE